MKGSDKTVEIKVLVKYSLQPEATKSEVLFRCYRSWMGTEIGSEGLQTLMSTNVDVRLCVKPGGPITEVAK